MLNELFQLSETLENHGLLESVTHPDVNKTLKADCLLIELDEEGKPQAIRLLSKSETGKLWRHSKGNHNSFPAIRVQRPLLDDSQSVKIDGAEWKKAKPMEKIALLSELDYSAINSANKDIQITGWTLSELAPVLTSDQPELAALKQLIQSFPRDEHTISFITLLLPIIKENIHVSGDEKIIDFIKELIVGKKDKKTGKYVSGCLTYYDAYNTMSFPNLVSSPTTKRSLINLLNSLNPAQDDNQANVEADDLKEQPVSFLSGRRGETIGDKFPMPNLPFIGQTPLFSLNSDIPCLMRYKTIGSGSFQARKDEVMAINDAIAFLTDEKRKNKTWKALSNSNNESPNLLLVYLTDDPENNAYLAQLVGDPSDYEEKEEYKGQIETAFDALCQQVLGNIDDLMQKYPLTKINLIVLEKIDTGRRQVAYANSLAAEQFRKNIINWSEASKNHPEIVIRVKDKEAKNSFLSYKHHCPGPNEICQLMKINYTRSGSLKPMKQSAISLSEIFQLYMPSDDSIAQDIDFNYDILQRVIRKTALMIGDTGFNLIASAGYKESPKRANEVLSSISVISILLWRLGARKETYMMEAPFNVGQFLQLTDMLHKEYCIQVRNGGDKSKSLPTQLMGNEMLIIASENPVEGLNRLRDRMKIYLAWADTFTGKDSGLAKWILARYGEVCEKISMNDLPEHFNAAEQAQTLLGYLARIPYEKKNDEIKTEKEKKSDE